MMLIRPSTPIAAALLAITLGTWMPGCAKIPTFGVYKLDVQQGNVITEEMLARLELGMEKNKVRFLLGTPLISDVFNPDRWDYAYSFQEGHGQRVQRHVVVIFEDDLLARIEGNVTPAAAKPDTAQTTETTVVSVPDYRRRTIFGRLGGLLGDDGTRTPTQPVVIEAIEEEEKTDEGALSKVFEGDNETDAESAPEVESDELSPEGEPSELPTDAEPEVVVLPAPASDDEEQGQDGSEPEVTDESSVEEEEKGFFQRLSERFGLGSEPEVEENAGEKPDEGEEEEP